MSGRDIICILIAYLLGGVCTGYYLVRLLKKTDVRSTGSGGVGARNTGRVLGRPGFLITLAGDLLKGLLAVVLARAFGLAPPVVSLVLAAVICGHIWPLFLQFRGGRGISTAIGALLGYDAVLALVLLALTVMLRVFQRGFILSGLGAFLLLPGAAYVLGWPGHTAAALAGTAAVILFAHRERIRQAVADGLPQKEA